MANYAPTTWATGDTISATKLNNVENGLNNLTIAGTANQVLVNGATTAVNNAAITLTLPQSIATGSSPSFAGLTVTGALTASADVPHLFGTAAAVDDPEELRKSTAGIAAFVLDSTGTGTPQFVARANPGATPTVELGSRSNHALLLLVNSAEKARFDTAGNLGLGVTPNTWSAHRAFQIGELGALWADVDGAGAGSAVNLSANAYFNAGYKRVIADLAALLTVANGAYQFQTAVTGTADSAITWTTPLTISNLGNIVPGSAALATTATDGFTYIQTCAGAPTGVPTAYTGRIAMVFDTSNNNLYVYDSGWLKVAMAA